MSHPYQRRGRHHARGCVGTVRASIGPVFHDVALTVAVATGGRGQVPIGQDDRHAAHTLARGAIMLEHAHDHATDAHSAPRCSMAALSACAVVSLMMDISTSPRRVPIRIRYAYMSPAPSGFRLVRLDYVNHPTH